MATYHALAITIRCRRLGEADRVLTLYSRDPEGNLKRELTFVALYNPMGDTPAILLRNMASSDLCRFVKQP